MVGDEERRSQASTQRTQSFSVVFSWIGLSSSSTYQLSVVFSWIGLSTSSTYLQAGFTTSALITHIFMG